MTDETHLPPHEPDGDEPDAPDGDNEPDGGGGGGGEGDEPEATAPEPAQGMSDKEREQALDKLDKEAKRHTARVAEIMGDEATILAPCPLCWTPGFIIEGAAGMLPPEQVAAVKAALGEPARPDYRDSEDATACPTCDALGVTLTGSKVPGQDTKPCKGCNGSGWIAAHQGQAITTPTAPAFTVQPPTTAPGNGQGVNDQWNRPPGHPHYGRDPASVYA